MAAKSAAALTAELRALAMKPPEARLRSLRAQARDAGSDGRSLARVRA